MHRSIIRPFTTILGLAVLLVALAGCIDRSGVHSTPTAALPCPPWVEFPTDAHSNEDSIYLGCVNEVNLSYMLVSPEDLARGRPLGPASGARESLGVDLYNQGKTNPTKNSGSAAPTILIPAAGGTAPQ